MKILLLSAALILSTTGCANYGRLSKNLANDGSILKLKVGTPWGIQELERVGVTTNTVMIEPNGRIWINPKFAPEPVKVEQPKEEKEFSNIVTAEELAELEEFFKKVDQNSFILPGRIEPRKP